MTAPVHTARPSAPPRERPRWRLGAIMPKGLYTRSLLIVILPMLLLQSVVALIFMDRHWEVTTRRLSTAVARDVAALIGLHEVFSAAEDRDALTEIAGRDLDIKVEFLPDQPLPAPTPPP